MKKITRSASEKLRRSGSISRTLIRSGLIKTQSNLINQSISSQLNAQQQLNTAAVANVDIKNQQQQQQHTAPKHRHSTDAGTSSILVVDNSGGNLDTNQLNQFNNNNFKSSLPTTTTSSSSSSTSSTVLQSTSGLTVASNSTLASVRSAHAQLTQVNKSYIACI